MSGGDLSEEQLELVDDDEEEADEAEEEQLELIVDSPEESASQTTGGNEGRDVKS